MKHRIAGAVSLRFAPLCLIGILALTGCSAFFDESRDLPAATDSAEVTEPVTDAGVGEPTGDAGEADPTDAPLAVPLPQTSVEFLADEPAESAGVANDAAEISVQQQGIEQLCREIGGKLGSVSQSDCLSQQLQPTDGVSILQRPLALKQYLPLTDREPLGRILMIGGIHGDEYSSVSIVFKWMNILNQHHSGLFHWHVIPLANPDGLLRETSRRQNENGVDLNRNFPSADWDELAMKYWVERTGRNARRYPGSGPASEPEVAWLVEHIEAFAPDIIISVHAPYHLVDYDGPPEAPQRLGDLYLTKLGVFPGSLGNYAGIDLNTPVVTIELPYAGIMPNDSHIERMWTDLVAWLRAELSQDD